MYPGIPFALHILAELPASLGFFFRPSATLTAPQPHAHGVIRQYGLLLTSTNLVAAVFLFQASSTTASCSVAAALALYHVGPVVRATGRVRIGEGIGNGLSLASPWLHILVHGICAVGLLGEAFRGW